jgi:hypothetical protein
MVEKFSNDPAHWTNDIGSFPDDEGQWSEFEVYAVKAFHERFGHQDGVLVRELRDFIKELIDEAETIADMKVALRFHASAQTLLEKKKH